MANKLDIPGAADRMKALSKKLRKKVVGISAATGEGVRELVGAIAALLAKTPAEVPRERIVHRFSMEADFQIERVGSGEYAVRGARVERLVAMTDLENEEAVDVLVRKLVRMGLEQELEEAGVEEGDTVRIGAYEFTYAPE